MKSAHFISLMNAPAGSKYIMQGNEAFALGVVHAGYHAADGYPGTPSTEVIDKGLANAQELMAVGWSVNEAVATAVGVGHAVAGSDTVVTMKIPGVFQAGDAISTSAFYTAPAGALVLYVASDYVPSSTQHVIDVRHFLASCRLPVLEPRNHGEMYRMPAIAADLSRQYNTPVVVLASGLLAHADGLVETGPSRRREKRPLPENLHSWMLAPEIARKNYNTATTERIPAIAAWAESSPLVSVSGGTDRFGVIVNGASEMIVREALAAAGLRPPILSLGISYPLPMEAIRRFAADAAGPLFIFEEGDRFIQDKLALHGVSTTGKNEYSVITCWTPEMVLEELAKHMPAAMPSSRRSEPASSPVKRPPSICPGCPYRAFALALDKLKKKKKVFGAFGDIGCSTLLYFLNGIDTVMCMGAGEGMRQGFVLSRPEMAGRTLSVLGDSCECHSGLDATRNAVFRETPGVKVILDNTVTAMTGGQPAPSSPVNLAGKPNRFVLRDAVAAEKGRMAVCNAYNLKEVERALTEALDLAEQGEFTTLILEGVCIQEIKPRDKVRQLEINREKCRKCGMCGICPGIEHDAERKPSFTPLCANCGGSPQVCMQRCPFGAIEATTPETAKTMPIRVLPEVEETPEPTVQPLDLPSALRVAIRGVGGQGNLFFGKALAELALRTSYAERHIIKGDTHGMAQLGGPVISTFACGDVFAPVLAPGSADVLAAMEYSEVLRPGFLELLKPGGTVVLNTFRVIPAAARPGEYPDLDAVRQALTGYNVKEVDAFAVAVQLGDPTGKSANVVVLGLLSTLDPFNRIPVGTWLSAIMAISPNDFIKAANRKAFEAGRRLSENRNG